MQLSNQQLSELWIAEIVCPLTERRVADSESEQKKVQIFPGRHTVKAHIGSRGVVALDLDVGCSGVSGQLHTAVPISRAGRDVTEERGVSCCCRDVDQLGGDQGPLGPIHT